MLTTSALKLGLCALVENTVFPVLFQWELNLRAAQLFDCCSPRRAAAANHIFQRST